MSFVDRKFSISVNIPYESLVEIDVYDRGDEPSLGLYRETKVHLDKDEIDPQELTSPSEADIEFRFEIPKSDLEEYEETVRNLIEEESAADPDEEEQLDPRRDTIYRLEVYDLTGEESWSRYGIDDLLETDFIDSYSRLRSQAFECSIDYLQDDEV